DDAKPRRLAAHLHARMGQTSCAFPKQGFSSSRESAALVQRRCAGWGCPLVSISPGVGLRPPPPPLLTTKGHPHPAPRNARWFGKYRSRAGSALQRSVTDGPVMVGGG